MGLGVWLVAAVQGQPPETLPRRADLGAAIQPTTRTSAARVARIDERSALHRAGLRPGDEIVALDGATLTDSIDFDRRFAALRGGQRIVLGVRREGHAHRVEATLAPLPRERTPGVETVYTDVVNPRGLRQRGILTRPLGASARLPATLFVPWLSCDSVEVPGPPPPSIEGLLLRIAAESGWVMLRVDKPGVGDSEGVCADTDLATEIDGSRAALKLLQTHPWVDASRIVIMGQSFSGAFLPLVAEQQPVAGYIFINSWTRTWLERLIEFERLQLEAAGRSPSEVSTRVRKLAELYVMMLEQGKTPGEAITERPHLADVWHDEPAHQYGRSARFHQQLQAIDPGGAWSTVRVPTLVMWSDADLVMHRWDHERLVALVNKNQPGAASLVIVPGGDHGLTARDARGTRSVPDVAPRAILEFLRRIAPAG